MNLRTFPPTHLINYCLQKFGNVRQYVILNLHSLQKWLICSASIIVLITTVFYSDSALNPSESLFSHKVLAILFDRNESVAPIEESSGRKLCQQNELLKILDSKVRIPNGETFLCLLETLVAEDISLARLALPNSHLVGINLTNADLRDANFKGANLQFAKLLQLHAQNINLSVANLQNTDFHMANLWQADLSNTSLQYANFTKSKLSGANLENANLQYANLTDAYMWRANLAGADLTETNLEHTVFWEANLEDADLSGAKHLTQAQLKGANLKNTKMPDDFCLSKVKGEYLRAV